MRCWIRLDVCKHVHQPVHGGAPGHNGTEHERTATKLVGSRLASRTAVQLLGMQLQNLQ